MNSPRIGISLGDPAGIGPEIIVRLIQEKAFPPASIIIFGQKKIMNYYAERFGISSEALERKIEEAGICFEEIGSPLAKIREGEPTAEAGRLSFEFFREAVSRAGSGELDVLVTAPVSKIAWAMAGLKYRGHTEYLEHLYPGCMMSFWSERLRVVLFTHHLPLGEAVKRVKKDAVKNFLLNLANNLKKRPFGIREVLVCGLNPHAGENGTLGDEEENEIIPAINEVRQSSLEISGPYPPDTVFLRALDRPEKMVLSFYHDQGLIPFKLVAFSSGVNLTLGLPFLRTSPDHGTAYDLAGRGKADTRSLKEAIWLAWRLVSS